MAVAEENVPLGLAPVMDEDILSAVNSLTVSVPPEYLPPGFQSDPLTMAPANPDYSAFVRVKYFVTGYAKVSDTMMFFRTSLGDRIHVRSSPKSAPFCTPC